MAFGGSGFGSSGFGNSSAPVFGTPSNTGLFGSSQAAGGPFGSSTPFASTPAFGGGGGFGASTQSGWGSSQPSPFGQTPTNQNTAGLWGAANSNEEPNSRSVKYQISVISENDQNDPGKYHTISAMEQFRNFSVEEIRTADYKRGDRGGPGPNDGSGGMFGNTNTGFGSQQQPQQQPQQQQGGFGSGFGSSSSGLFGGSNTFGAQSQSNLFGNSGGGFGASTGNSLFGSQNQSGGLFANTGGSLFGQQSSSGFGNTNTFANMSSFGNTSGGFGNTSAFGSSNTAGGFGASSSSLFTTSNFGNNTGGQSGFGQSSSNFGFGASSQSLFASAGANQSGTTNLFGSSQPQASTGANLFGNSSGFTSFSSAANTSNQSAPSLFGSTTPTFGTGFSSANPTSAPGFTASSSAFNFAASSSNLFGTSSGFGFGASSASNLFNTSASLFSNSQPAYAASSSSMFGTGFGFGNFGSLNNNQNNQQQQPQIPNNGPLLAALSNNPYGDSKLFTDLPKQQSSTLDPKTTSVVKAPPRPGQTQSQELSVVLDTRLAPARRVRGSETIARQSTMLRKNTGANWLSSGAMRPWNNEGSLFNPTSNLKSEPTISNNKYSLEMPWRTEEQARRAANIKKLDIEHMDANQLFPRSEIDDFLREKPVHFSNGGRPASTNIAQKVLETPQTQIISRSDHKRPQSARYDRSGLESGKVRQRYKNEEADVVEVVDLVGEGNINQKRPSPKRTKESPQKFTNKTEDELHIPVKEENNSRFIPYSDYYKKQFSNTRRRLSIGSGGESQASKKSSAAPKCVNPDMYTIPSLNELQKMSEEELSHVENFTVGRTGIGEVSWITPTDVRFLDLDLLVVINPRNISVYPRDEDLPPRGEGLNKQTRMKLHGIWKKNKKTKTGLKDASAAASMVKALKQHCDDNGWQFLGYDVRMGTWMFGADGF